MNYWKLSTAALAVTATLAIAIPRGGHDKKRTATSSKKGNPTAPMALRPLRVDAARAGINEDELLAQLERSHNTVEIFALLDKIGTVGSEQAFPVLTKLAEDRRSGVGAAALDAIGHIGGDEA